MKLVYHGIHTQQIAQFLSPVELAIQNNVMSKEVVLWTLKYGKQTSKCSIPSSSHFIKLWYHFNGLSSALDSKRICEFLICIIATKDNIMQKQVPKLFFPRIIKLKQQDYRGMYSFFFFFFSGGGTRRKSYTFRKKSWIPHKLKEKIKKRVGSRGNKIPAIVTCTK